MELTENKLSEAISSITPNKKFAVGNDLVFIPGFQHSLNELFIKKVYTPGEITYCELFADSMLRYASTWAAKEAVYKAAKQIDPATLGWKNIEISRAKIGGQPNVTLHSRPEGLKISLTISHDGDYVWAVAFIAIE